MCSGFYAFSVTFFSVISSLVFKHFESFPLSVLFPHLNTVNLGSDLLCGNVVSGHCAQSGCDVVPQRPQPLGEGRSQRGVDLPDPQGLLALLELPVQGQRHLGPTEDQESDRE